MESNNIDSSNSLATVTFGGTFVGVWKFCAVYQNISVNMYAVLPVVPPPSLFTDLVLEWSNDSAPVTKTILNTQTFTIVMNTGFAATAPVIASYYRLTYNGPSTTVKLQSILQLSGSNVLFGRQISTPVPIAASSISSSLSTNVQEPTTAFGEIISSPISWLVQSDFVYGLNPTIGYSNAASTGALGVVQTLNGVVTLTTASVLKNLVQYTSLANMRYQAGQGSVVRFTAIFSLGVANNNQYVGLNNYLSALYFGYQGTTFGVLRQSGGTLAVQTLTVTAVATVNPTITINLFDGATMRSFVKTYATSTGASAFTVGGLAAQIADSVPTSLYPGWSASANAGVVTFICHRAQPNNPLTFTSPNATLVAASVQLGIVPNFVPPTGTVASESEFISQSNWNLDTMDGNGPSGMILNPQVGNMYQITFQYLGFGAIVYSVGNASNGKYVPVHRVNFCNKYTTRNLKNPNFNFSCITDNQNTTTPVTVQCGSFAMGVQGVLQDNGIHASFNITVPLSTTTVTQILALQTSVINNFSGIYQIDTTNIILENVNIAVTANNTTQMVIIRLFVGSPGLNGSVVFSTANYWNAVPIAPVGTSNALINSATTTSIPLTAGTLINTFNVAAGNSITINLRERFIFGNTWQSMYMLAQCPAISGAGPIIYLSLQWTEN